MNDKTTLKIIKSIMEDSSIPDSEKLEAVKKLTDSCTTYVPYYPDQFPFQDPYPVFPWESPTYTQPFTCTGNLEIQTTCDGDDIDTASWLKPFWLDHQ